MVYASKKGSAVKEKVSFREVLKLAVERTQRGVTTVEIDQIESSDRYKAHNLTSMILSIDTSLECAPHPDRVVIFGDAKKIQTTLEKISNLKFKDRPVLIADDVDDLDDKLDDEVYTH